MKVFDRACPSALAASAIVMVVLAACAKSADAPADAASPSPATPIACATRQERSATAPGVDRKVEDHTGVYEFDYAYPAAADGIRPLKTLLDGELAKMKAELIVEANSAQVDAKKNGYPFHAYSSAKAWSVVTNLPGWLSLSATIYSYTGGAHGMTVFDTLLWDKQAGQRRYPIDLFVSKAAFRAAVAKPLCAALDRERLKRRDGEPLNPDDEFSKCIDPIDDATIILGSRDHQHFDRIGFLIPPYNAGPYAEGEYDLTLTVTPEVIAAVKPAYRAAFVSR